VPGERESPPGTPGILPRADLGRARGVFQILIRLVYLRTQTEPWRWGGRADADRPAAQDLLWMLRGMEVAACEGGLDEYARMCARILAQLERMTQQPLPPAWLGHLDAWLAGSARHLRDPEDARAAAALRDALALLEACAGS
jgi:hypothetical protein